MVLPDKCEAINLIVMGDTGSGKSSFVNTLKTVLRNNDQIANVAPCYGTNYGSTTRTVFNSKLFAYFIGFNYKIGEECFSRIYTPLLTII